MFNIFKPITCKNFIDIITSKHDAQRPRKGTQEKKNNRTIPTYRKTEIHRVIPGFMIQGGDYENFDGTGGGCFNFFQNNNLNGGCRTQQFFNDETFEMKHDDAVLSMANRGKNTNGSQFFITLKKAHHLDGKHVAFGRVIHGMDVIHKIAQVETENNDRPILLQRVVILDCGLLMDNSSSTKKKRKKKKEKKKPHKERNIQSSSDDSSTFDSDSSGSREDRRHRHKKRKRKHKRRTGDRDDSEERAKKRRKKHKREKRHRERRRRERYSSPSSSSDDD